MKKKEKPINKLKNEQKCNKISKEVKEERRKKK